MTVILSDQLPFAQGGNRLCFVHPERSDRCIKVRRPDFTLEDLRRKKGFPKNLRPLSWFDDNLEEERVMADISERIGEEAFEVISRCFGFENTDMGHGLTSELVRDGDGRISQTLKQTIWNDGYNEELRAAVERFGSRWINLGIPSRDLLVHNLLVQRDENRRIKRLVMIDGLGSSSAIPDQWLSHRMKSKRAARKVANLNERIQVLLEARSRGEFPGFHGRLMHDGLATQDTTVADKKEH